MKRGIALAVIINLFLICLISSSALALGVAIGPQTLKIEDALRGGVYERVVTVFNPSEPDTAYTIRAEGNAAAWLSFYRWDTEQPIDTFNIPGKSNVTILIKVSVPVDIANDIYTATIYAETAPIDVSGETGVSAKMQASSQLTISVTGTQKIEGTVGSITVRDTEVGIPLRFEVNLKNTGNVEVKPRIDCQISQDDIQIATFTHDTSSVKPGSQENISVEWDTSNAQIGDYTADLQVSLNGNILDSRKATFKIVPPGTFTMQGELIDLKYEGQAAYGHMSKLLADFENTGESDVLAKLSIEVYKNSELVDVLESEETLAPIGEITTLTTYFRPTEKVNYSLNGFVTYSGKQSNQKVIIINLAENSASSLLWPILGGIAGVLIISGIFVFWRRRNRGASHHP